MLINIAMMIYKELQILLGKSIKERTLEQKINVISDDVSLACLERVNSTKLLGVIFDDYCQIWQEKSYWCNI